MFWAVMWSGEIFVLLQKCSGMTGGEKIKLEAGPVWRWLKELSASLLSTKKEKTQAAQYLRINWENLSLNKHFVLLGTLQTSAFRKQPLQAFGRVRRERGGSKGKNCRLQDAGARTTLLGKCSVSPSSLLLDTKGGAHLPCTRNCSIKEKVSWFSSYEIP